MSQIPRGRLSLGTLRSRGDAEDGLGFALEGLSGQVQADRHI